MILVDHSKGTRNHAIAAAITDIRLHIYRSNFGPNDRARGTRFQASGVLAVLADIGEELPTKRLFYSGELRTHGLLLFQKEHVPPRRCSQRMRVVVRLTSPVEPIVGDVVPLLTGHFTGLATYAY